MLLNEEFDNLKEELLWEGSKVAILRYAPVLDSCSKRLRRGHVPPVSAVAVSVLLG